MKYSIISGVVVFLSLSTVALAQEDTAVATLAGLEAQVPYLVAVVSGFVGRTLTSVFNDIGWLSTDSQKKLTKLARTVAGLVIPAVVVVLSTELLPLAGYLDKANIWPLIVAGVGVANVTHFAKKFQPKSKVIVNNNG